MLARVIHFSIQNRLFVLIGAAIVMIYGGWESSRLPVDVFPDLNRPTVTVMTEAAGLAPEEVETLVTFPIETALNGATGVRRVRSNSGVGLSIVFVEFDWGMEILRARQLVSEKLQLVQEQLPAGIQPQMGPISSIMGEIMLIGIQSKDPKRSPMEVRTIADWTIRPRLLTVAGVSQVIPIGGGRMQIQVKVDPAKLKALNLSMEEVGKAIENANQNSTGGFLEQRGQEWLVRNIGRIDKLEDLSNSVITYRDGVPVLLKSVATVEQDIQVKRGDASVNASPAVIMSVQKQPGADTVRLTEVVQATLKDLKRTLPPDIEVNEHLFLQANFIRSAIDNVAEAMKESALLVTIVLILFLLNWRTTVISLIALPTSFIVTMLFFKFAGISINTMTLGGLAVAIGEVVDDAIVDVENIFRRLRENRLLPVRRNPLKVIFAASNEVRSSIVYATLMMCVAFIPLFQMSGLEGRMFRPLGIAYIVTILSSLVVSLTLTPALAAVLLPKSRSLLRREKESILVRVLKRLDLVQLRFSLTYPNLVMVSFYALTGICVWVFLHFGKEFLPPFNEGTMTVTMIAQPGTSLEESNRLGHQAEKLIMKVPEVTAIGRRTGRAELDEHAEGVHVSEIEVDLKKGRPRDVIFADVRAKLSMIQGVVLNIGQPISHRLDHMLSGVNAQIAIKVFGDDLGVLRERAEQVRAVMATVPGVKDLFVEKQIPIPQLRIKILREEAKKYGIQVGDLARTLEGALYGAKVSEVLEGQRRYDLVVKFTEQARQDPDALRELLVDTPQGVKVPLKAVADLFDSTGPNTINREDVQRRIVVQANVADRDVGTVVEEIQAKLDSQVKPGLPAGYFISVEGQFEAQQQAARTIALLSVVSLAVMYLLLYNLFGVHRVVWCILMNVPLAMIGCVLAVAFTTQTFSIASLMGFITLTGVSLRNGIMLIEHYITLMRDEGEQFSKEMIIRGSLERLVPVLMTAMTSLLAMIPFVFAERGAPGKEILEPMAMVIFAGTLSSTLLDIMYTPAFFWRWCGPVVPKLLRAEGRDFMEAPDEHAGDDTQRLVLTGSEARS